MPGFELEGAVPGHASLLLPPLDPPDSTSRLALQQQPGQNVVTLTTAYFSTQPFLPT